MADLKDKAGLEKNAAEVAERVLMEARKRLQDEVAETVRSARVAAEALAALPPKSNDLLTSATVALTEEVVFGPEDREHWINQVILRTNRGDSHYLSASPHQREGFAPGTYRAIFFLIPMCKAKP